MAKKKTPDKVFHYAIGRPWHADTPESSVCFYTYHNQIHQGTMKDALKFRDYCNEQKKKDKEDFAPYRVYLIVEVPDSEKSK